MTDQYQHCPIIYRTVLDVSDEPTELVGFRANISEFAYVFLNGHQIESYVQEGESDTKPLDVELGHLLKSGRNVLAISTSAESFSLKGCISYSSVKVQEFT